MSAIDTLAAAVPGLTVDGRIDWGRLAELDVEPLSSGERAVVGWLRMIRRGDPLLVSLDRPHRVRLLAALAEQLLGPDPASGRWDPAHGADG